MGSRLSESEAEAQPGKFPQPLPFLREGSSWKAPALQEERRRKWLKVLTVVAVVALFVLCWMPFYVLNIINVVCPLPEEPAFFGLYFLVVALPYANSCANPILYGFLSYRFKQGFRRALLRPSRRVQNQEPPVGPPEKTEEEEEDGDGEDRHEGAGKPGDWGEMNGRVNQIIQPGPSGQEQPPSSTTSKEHQFLPQEPSAGEKSDTLHISYL